MKKSALIIFALTILALFFVSGPAAAFNITHLKQLLKTGSCPDCNLTGADLGKADLRSANLSGANLNGAILVKTNLHGAKLSGAKLGNARLNMADLSGADLTDAKLMGADLSGTIWTDGIRCKAGSLGKCRR